MTTNKVILYTKSNCQQCVMTKSFLDRHEIDYQIRDIEKNPEFYDEVIKLNYRSLPVVVSELGNWAGFVPENLNMILSLQK